MVVNNIAKENVTSFLAGSSISYPTNTLIGIGSSTDSVTSETLASGVDAQVFTSTTIPSSKKVKWETNWNSVEMSGIQLSEFGLSSGSEPTGSIMSKTTFPSLEFNGSNELKVETVWEVY